MATEPYPVHRYSVVIPAYNAQQFLGSCLESIQALETPPSEVILVDDASTDATAAIAENHAVQLIRLEENVGAGRARNAGTSHTTGDVIVFVDADIAVRPNAIDVIADCFRRHPEAGAVTGCLDGNAPVDGYFSRYKNRYMAFVFSQLPKQVDFLYTSAAAVRRSALAAGFSESVSVAEDTELGMRLAAAGVQIVFCDALRVLHLKQYSLRSFYRNNFRVPYGWAAIFLARFDPKALVRKRRFAHASLTQILGLGLASSSLLAAAAWLFGWLPFWLPLAFFLAAIGTNLRFLMYLFRHEGLGFALTAILVSYVDQVVMSAGVIAGSAAYLIRSFSPSSE